MKNKEQKHDHKFTKLLKVCLFALLMLMPLLALTPNILYYAFNEHATNEQETTVNIEYEYQTNEVTNWNTDLVEGNIYNFYYNLEEIDFIDTNTSTDDGNGYIILIINTNEILEMFTYEDEYMSGYWLKKPITLMVIQPNAAYIQLFGSMKQWDNGDYLINNVIDEYQDIPITITGVLITTNNELLDTQPQNFNVTECPQEDIPIKTVNVETEDTNIQSSLENAANQLWNSNVFSWVENTTIATGLYAFTSVMGIPNNTMLSNLIVYWLIMTAIYVVIDIVIELFIYLTHILNG